MFAAVIRENHSDLPVVPQSAVNSPDAKIRTIRVKSDSKSPRIARRGSGLVQKTPAAIIHRQFWRDFVMLRKSIFLALTLLAPGLVFAQAEQAAEEEGPWSGAASLGYLSTSGNTDTTSYNTKLGVGYASGDWTHAFAASANGAAKATLRLQRPTRLAGSRNST